MKRRLERKTEDSSDTDISRRGKGQRVAHASSTSDMSKDTSTRHTRGESSATEPVQPQQNSATCPQRRRHNKKKRRKNKSTSDESLNAECEEMYCPPLSEQGGGNISRLPNFSARTTNTLNLSSASRTNTESRGTSGRTRSNYRNKSKGKGGSHEQTSAETSSKPSSSTDPPEIPGMYYDRERKRYFHILPTGSTISGGITRETIAAKEAEYQRKKDLEKLAQAKSVKSASATVGRSQRTQCSFLHLLAQCRMGSVGSLQLRRTVARDTVASLQLQGTMAVFEQPQGEQERVEHMLQVNATEDGSQLLALWSVQGTMMQRMQLLTIDHKPRQPQRAMPRDLHSWGCNDGRDGSRSSVRSSQGSASVKDAKADSSVSTLPLKVDPRGMTVLQSWNKITKVCWAPFPQFPGKKYVLYTTMCHAGYIYSLAFIRNLDPDARDDVCYFDFNLGRQTTWTCAWDQHHQRFSVGVDKSCLIIDTMSRRLWEYPTQNSDPLTQTFDHAKGQLLYSGIRRGQVLQLDLRTSSRQQSRVTSGSSPLACLTLSKDDLYLYTNDFSGVVRKWDLRMRRPVMDYAGYDNQYARLPLHLSHDETLLYAVGQNSYTYFWDTASGRSLLKLPPPRSASQDFLPAVQYHAHWGGPSGSPGLVMGLQNKLYLYSGFGSPDALEA